MIWICINVNMTHQMNKIYMCLGEIYSAKTWLQHWGESVQMEFEAEQTLWYSQHYWVGSTCSCFLHVARLSQTFLPRSFLNGTQESTKFLVLSDKSESAKAIVCSERACLQRAWFLFAHNGERGRVRRGSIITLEIKGWAVNPTLSLVSQRCSAHSCYLHDILSALIPALLPGEAAFAQGWSSSSAFVRRLPPHPPPHCGRCGYLHLHRDQSCGLR